MTSTCPILSAIEYLGADESRDDPDTRVNHFNDTIACDGVKYFQSVSEILFARAKISGNLPQYLQTMPYLVGNSHAIARQLSRRLLPVEPMRVLARAYREYISTAIANIMTGSGATVVQLFIPERLCAIETPECILRLYDDVRQWQISSSEISPLAISPNSTDSTTLPPEEIQIPTLRDFEIPAMSNPTAEDVETIHGQLREILEYLRAYERIYCAICNFVIGAIRSHPPTGPSAE